VGASKKTEYRPSPKYTPKPDGSANELEAKPKGVGKAKPKGAPWQRIERPQGSGGTQEVDKRSALDQAWGALPKAKDKPLTGQGQWGKDAPRAMAGPGVSDSDWEKMQGKGGKGGSHLPRGTERDKETRMGLPDPNQKQKDLHSGEQGWTKGEKYLKDNPMDDSRMGPQPMQSGPQPMMGGGGSGQFASAKSWIAAQQPPPPAPGPSNNDLMAKWEQSGRRGPKPAMFE
jgi:hypothetical protein